LEIQEELITRISYAERRIRKLKDEAKNLKASIKSNLKKTDSLEKKARKKLCHERVSRFQELTSILRQVGDALAFTYIDKYDIKPMAFKPPPGSLSGKKGNRFERRILRKAFEIGDIAILNDLTNCLRYGDVTLIKNDEFYLIEAKKGKLKSQRTNRQEAGLRMICEYMRNDEVHGLYGNPYPIHRVELSTTELNHQSKLTELVSTTPKGHDSYLILENGLAYAIFSGPEMEKVFSEISEQFAEPLGLPVNDLLNQNTGYFPFTLSIRNPEALLRFFLGEFVILVFVDIQVFKSAYSNRGMQLELKLQDSECPLELVDVRPDLSKSGRCRISRHYFQRIQAEFLSLEWFVQETADRTEQIWETIYESDEPDISQACPRPTFIGDDVIMVPVSPKKSR